MTSCANLPSAPRATSFTDIAIELPSTSSGNAARALRERITVTGQRERTAEIQLSLNCNPIFHSVPSANNFRRIAQHPQIIGRRSRRCGCCIRDVPFAVTFDGRDLQRPLNFDSRSHGFSG